MQVLADFRFSVWGKFDLDEYGDPIEQENYMKFVRELDEVRSITYDDVGIYYGAILRTGMMDEIQIKSVQTMVDYFEEIGTKLTEVDIMYHANLIDTNHLPIEDFSDEVDRVNAEVEEDLWN